MTAGGGGDTAAGRSPSGHGTTPFAGLVLGGASYAGLYRATDPATAQAALQAAWDGGIRAFDTAPHYGAGQSEERLGRFLRGRVRSDFVVSTKVGRLLYDDPAAADGTDQFFGVPRRSRRRDYSADGVRRSVEASLRRLGLDRVDLLLVHDPDEHVRQALDEAVPELSRMRANGLVTGIGVGVNDADLALRFVRDSDIDHVMIAGRYSLLDRRAEELLAECARRHVAVLVAGALNSGLLADPERQGTFNYVPAPAALLGRARAMRAACERFGVALRAAALQFPLRHPAVDAVVSGAGTAADVSDTFDQMARPIPAALWAELSELAAAPDDLP